MTIIPHWRILLLILAFMHQGVGVETSTPRAQVSSIGYSKDGGSLEFTLRTISGTTHGIFLNNGIGSFSRGVVSLDGQPVTPDSVREHTLIAELRTVQGTLEERCADEVIMALNQRRQLVQAARQSGPLTNAMAIQITERVIDKLYGPENLAERPPLHSVDTRDPRFVAVRFTTPDPEAPERVLYLTIVVDRTTQKAVGTASWSSSPEVTIDE